MSRLIAAIDAFFFRSVSASGFGLLRMGWAATAFAFFLMQWRDVPFLYSNAGLVPSDFTDLFRAEFRMTVLDIVRDPIGVYVLYGIMLCAMLAMLAGWHARAATVISVLLTFSFHERNLLPLGGGDTVLRATGFLLMIAPELRAFSVDRLRAQWTHWQRVRELLPPLRMSIWPWRLLLWQFIVIYVTSALDKLDGEMWLAGTAVVTALHHPHFARWPLSMMDYAAPFSAAIGYASLLWEGAWLLLLVPRRALRVSPHALRRALLIGGVLFHGGIQLLMDVGSFSFAMLAGYLGLLLDEDFADARARMNRRWARSRAPRASSAVLPASARITVLYDGICRLCRRSAFMFGALDHLHRLRLVDFRDVKARKSAAPGISLEDLDRALHIIVPGARNERPMILEGFDAFRMLARHLPLLWPMVPLLSVPGIALLGRACYRRIAERRVRCADGMCWHEH